MNEYLKQMIAHGHAEVETYPLAQLQRQVDKMLNLKIIYHPKPGYWIDKITSEEN